MSGHVLSISAFQIGLAAYVGEVSLICHQNITLSPNLEQTQTLFSDMLPTWDQLSHGFSCPHAKTKEVAHQNAP